jgi:hypothetical protein
MISLWVVIGLIAATVAVSTLGAAFSVIGLSALFAGAAKAVIAMAASLELAKFVLSAYLHQRWGRINLLMRSYLVFAIVVLSLITSMGIFGFLSDAYQSSSATLEAENIKLAALKTQQQRNADEINRINHNIDEIPAGRISKRLKARADAEPLIAELTKQSQEIDQRISQANLHILEVKQKVGPLIYIARVFNLDIDTVVKYLILILVCVFDPLAISLVIATSESMMSRRQAESSMVTREENSAPLASSPVTPPSETGSAAKPSFPTEHGGDDEIIQMRFTDDKDRNSV